MTDRQHPLDDLMPTSPLAQIAWVDALRWAIGNYSLIGQFQKDTGLTVVPVSNPLDAMIDAATGLHQNITVQFVKWFNANIWGEVNGRACNGDEPEIVRRAEEV